MINPIPLLPSALKEAAQTGTLVPFIGAGVSRIAGCPNWGEFADRALRFFVEKGKFTYSQIAQLSQQPPRVKLSVALALQREHNLPISFDSILYPAGRNNDSKGRQLYSALTRLGKIFVTTNYDDWLESMVDTSSPGITSENASATPSISEKPTVICRVDELTPDVLDRTASVIHLHGSISEPATMVLTTRDYVRHYANDRRKSASDENKVLTFLEFLFSQRNVLFVGYGLEEMEILEYVIEKAPTVGHPGSQELRHFLLQGFFSHEEELAYSLGNYYADCGIELIPFLRDHKDWDQLIEVLEEYARLAPAEAPLNVQKLKEMEALLDG